MTKTVHVFSLVEGLASTLSNKKLPIIVKNIADGDVLNESQLQSLQNAEVLVTDPSLLRKHKLAQDLPNLKFMQSTWAGVDPYFSCLDPAKPRPSYKLSRLGGIFGEHMAEYVIGHMISHERYFLAMKQEQAKSNWIRGRFHRYRLLRTLQMGILGLGDIGKEVAKACKNLNMTVWGLVNSEVKPENKVDYVDHYRRFDGLGDILEECDYITCVLPSTPQTRQMLSGNVLSKCKKKPVLINVGRGDLIDEKTLITALDQQWISHAILDVTDPEPLPSTSSLWQHPQVTITPHCSAIGFDWQLAGAVAENIQRYLNDEPLKYQVDLDKGY